MDVKNSLSSIIGSVRTRVPIALVCTALIGGLLLIFAGDEKSENEAMGTTVSRETVLEESVERLLLSLSDIDSATAIVTVEDSGEYKYAKNEHGIEGDGSYSGEYFVIEKKDGDEALLVREVYPEIRGIAVVCTGGDTPAVREKVIRLLSAAFGMSTNKIEVAGT